MNARALYWVVSEGDSKLLGTLLGRFGSAARGALEQGRVFVDGRRTSDPRLRLSTGQVVALATPRHDQQADAVCVLDEREGLLAAYKPAALSTEPDRRGTDSLCSRVAALRGLSLSDIHALSRLDRGVSGVVLLAADAAARAHALRLREQGRIVRRYVAIAGAVPAEQTGLWQTPIGDRTAATRYMCLKSASGCGLLVLEPATGRMHQLRIHAARAAAPLLGDHTYGGARRRVLPGGSVIEFERIMLHAAALSLPDPGGEPWRVVAPIPDALLVAWQRLGGSSGVFDEAVGNELFGSDPAENA